MGIEELIGKTIVKIGHDKYSQFEITSIVFKTDDDQEFIMHHSNECCESVYVVDICGELQDLIGNVITEASVEQNEDFNYPENYYGDTSCTLWTFYKIGTNKGSVTIRWFGGSNGFYSVEVDFEKITPENRQNRMHGINFIYGSEYSPDKEEVKINELH